MSPPPDPNAPTATDAGRDGPERTQVVPFELQETRYCVETSAVSGALGVSRADSIAAAPDPWYAGEVTLEGDRIRVVDLARIFGSPTAPVDRGETPRLLVFERADADERRFGWLVDAIGVSTTVSRAELASATTPTRFIRGHLERDGERLVWVDEAALNE